MLAPTPSTALARQVEKAHREVMNVLLSMLDDGRLTDSKGRTVSFANTIVIFTSNLGAEFLMGAKDAPLARERVLQAVRGHFRPEFINR